jgi:integrase
VQWQIADSIDLGTFSDYQTFSDTSRCIIESHGRSLPLIFPTKVPLCCTFDENCCTDEQKLDQPMGTVIGRTRKDGTTAYLAQILLKRKGKIVHRESKTFDRKQAARAWLSRRETELSEPGARDQKPDVRLTEVIDRYVADAKRPLGSTKKQVLNSIKNHDIADRNCSDIKSPDLVAFAQSLNVQPQTRQSYMSHLSGIFAVARPMWGYRLDQREMQDAMVVCRRMGITSAGNSRDRRPTLAELDRIMEHFEAVRRHRPMSLPMNKVLAFAIFSTRRQEEITRIKWEDYDVDHVWIRDMKDPEKKKGNDILCDLPPEAVAIIESMPRTATEIFPFSTDAISAAFTRACKFLEIEDLHFHDLRHEGISRLFEMGKTIPQVAAVSGHRTWNSLKRYTHLRQAGDKYAGWKWLTVV